MSRTCDCAVPNLATRHGDWREDCLVSCSALLLVGVFFCRHVVVRLWRSAFVDLIGDAWRCQLVPDFFVRTSQGARLLLLDASTGVTREALATVARR